MLKLKLKIKIIKDGSYTSNNDAELKRIMLIYSILFLTLIGIDKLSYFYNENWFS